MKVPWLCRVAVEKLPPVPPICRNDPKGIAAEQEFSERCEGTGGRRHPATDSDNCVTLAIAWFQAHEEDLYIRAKFGFPDGSGRESGPGMKLFQDLPESALFHVGVDLRGGDV